MGVATLPAGEFIFVRNYRFQDAQALLARLRSPSPTALAGKGAVNRIQQIVHAGGALADMWDSGGIFDELWDVISLLKGTVDAH